MSLFANAVQFIINGNTAQLRKLLAENPTLIHQRAASNHKATLLHYVAANGVEDELQKTPPNIIEITQILLEAGSDVDAVCESYGGGVYQTTLNLLISSGHPAEAGVQVDLVKVLADAGANVNGVTEDGSPCATTLMFWYPKAFNALVESGASLNNIVFAAAAGRIDLLANYWDASSNLKVQEVSFSPPFTTMFPHLENPQNVVDLALVKAGLCGQVEAIQFLVDKGVKVNAHPVHHMTALHEAAWTNQVEAGRWLLVHGAGATIRDDQFNTTPLGWAEHAGHTEFQDLMQN